MQVEQELFQKATKFIQKAYAELGLTEVETRLVDIRQEIALTGTYKHTFKELEHGVRMAWRNSNRCIGRLYWKSLILNDQRNIKTASDLFSALENHILQATNNGKILPLITVFPPKGANGSIPFRIWNKQLIRYAAHEQADGTIIGDPAQLAFTKRCKQLGWDGNNCRFDILPIVIQEKDNLPELYQLNPSSILEVNITHPSHKWFEELNLKWHALPVISDMVLEVGGIHYPAAPFNGWYMVTEIGSRNFGDENRYNLLPTIADKLGLALNKQNPFWKDKAIVILNEAVYFSFKNAGVTITDHHSASEQFIKFIQNEKSEERVVHADWSWIVPPLSGSTLKVFHQDYTNEMITPNFFYNNEAWKPLPQKGRCPFHIDSQV